MAKDGKVFVRTCAGCSTLHDTADPTGKSICEACTKKGVVAAAPAGPAAPASPAQVSVEAKK